MKKWWEIRKEIKKLKKAGMLKYFTKEQLKCVATLYVLQKHYIIINNGNKS